MRYLLLTGLVFLASASVAGAVEPVGAQDNQCIAAGGQGKACSTNSDCSGNAFATTCIEQTVAGATTRTCQIPCQQGTGISSAKHVACATGETCVQGKAVPSKPAWWCKPSRFRVDLNLLDTCVVRFLTQEQPVFSANHCSLDANLNKLLDQNRDNVYDIFDLDLCVLAFFEQPGCDPTTSTCEADDLVVCNADSDCGEGLYCHPQRKACLRDCGIIPSREEAIEPIERPCAGALETCDFTRGQCKAINPATLICEVDSDCTSGAYCFLGRCAPRCYRSLDCPGSDWYCAETNKCRAVPPPASQGAPPFDPRNYAIRFARDQLDLDAVKVSDASQMVIIDLLSRRQVVDNPAASFGYRLELKYDLKQDAKCLVPFVDCKDAAARPASETEAECTARQDDCLIEPAEQFIRLLSPFGVVSAAGRPSIGIELEQTIAGRLTPGVYTATLRAIFDNGDSHTTQVRFTKASPSGEYSGLLSVTLGDGSAAITGLRPLNLAMRMRVTSKQTTWDQLLKDNNLDTDKDITDVTSGFFIQSQIEGSESFAFTKGSALKAADDIIDVVGLYSPDTGRIRLIGIIEIAKDMCIGNNGACTSSDDKLQVRNLFGRKIRRQLEFIGPFDEATGTFNGIYREKIGGLASSFDVTLEGSFVVSQVLADDSPVPIGVPLLPSNAARVSFPNQAEVMAKVEADIAQYCGAAGGAYDNMTKAGAQAAFASKTAYDAYVESAKRAGVAGAPFGRTTIFPDLVTFSSAIEEALASVSSTEKAESTLNIYDFLANRVLPCDSDSGEAAPTGAICVDETKVRCGLALYQKAIASGWVSFDEVEQLSTGPLGGEIDLFCLDTLPLDSCTLSGAAQPGLVGMQEHNRFWRNLGEAVRFGATNARSDAFLTLFRNALNPFAQGAALGYKAERLEEAMRRYDQVVELFVNTPAARVLFEWPARSFQGAGQDWLKIMHAILNERMQALVALVDLKRRSFWNTGEVDFIFAHQLMQQEYLLQVYMLVLQQNWQKETFAPGNDAAELFEQGQLVLNQLNPARNRLGLQSDRVFFENSDVEVTNWQRYRDILRGEDIDPSDNGLVGLGQDAIAEALVQLKGSLADIDALEGSIHESRLELRDRLNDVCGDPDPKDGKSTSYCQAIREQFASSDVFKKLRDCTFDPDATGCDEIIEKATVCKAGSAGPWSSSTCVDEEKLVNPLAFACASYGGAADEIDNSCQDVVAQFMAGTGDDGTGVLGAPVCDLDTDDMWLVVAGERRPCVGGEMGVLIQEKALLDRQRNQVVEKLEAVARSVEADLKYLEQFGQANADLLERKSKFVELKAVMSGAIKAVKVGLKMKNKLGQVPQCVVIAGLATGTDCPQKAVGTGIQVAAAALGLIAGAMEVAKELLEKRSFAKQLAFDTHVTALGADRDARQGATAAVALISEFESLTQQSFNVALQIHDLRYQAQDAVDRFGEEVSFLADHLVGRETGNLLIGQGLVNRTDVLFRKIVDYTYRMVVAFNHEYNVSPVVGQAMINEALSLVTMDDVITFLDSMFERERQYCGLEGLDCDTVNSVETLRFSLRERLFPQLRDVVDAATGTVVTAGEQFHNLITTPPFVKRRIRGNMPVNQIELPFALFLTMIENGPAGPAWLIDPLTCNHHLDGRDPADATDQGAPDASASRNGTMAVNVQLRQRKRVETANADPKKPPIVTFPWIEPSELTDRLVRYEMIRGSTDYMRACNPESVVAEFGTLPVLSYPVRTQTVGYAPQSSLAQQTVPPIYATRSNPMTACINFEETHGTLDDAPCWRLFARDRSLAAPDWKVIVPLEIDGASNDNTWVAGEGLTAQLKPIIDDIVLYFRYRTRPIQEL